MKELICIICPNGCHLQVTEGEKVMVSGNLCKRGVEFAMKELTNPTRTLTTTVRTSTIEMPVLPVRTDGELPKEKLKDAMIYLNKLTIHPPITCGQIIVEQLLGYPCNVIATCDLIP